MPRPWMQRRFSARRGIQKKRSRWRRDLLPRCAPSPAHRNPDGVRSLPRNEGCAAQSHDCAFASLRRGILCNLQGAVWRDQLKALVRAPLQGDPESRDAWLPSLSHFTQSMSRVFARLTISNLTYLLMERPRPNRCAAFNSFCRVRNNFTLIVFSLSPVIAASSSTECPSTSLRRIRDRSSSETFSRSFATKSCCAN